MLDLKFIRTHPDVVRAAIRDKAEPLDLDDLLAADATVLRLSRALQQLQEQRNENAKLIPRASPDERATLVERGRAVASEIAAHKPQLDQAQARLRELQLLTPGIPAEHAPRGESEAHNVVVRAWGEAPRFGHRARDHVELLQKNGWYELERVAKIAGSRSYALRGEAVLLELAVLRFALDAMVARGFTPISVPSFAHRARRCLPHRDVGGDAQLTAQRRDPERGRVAGPLRGDLLLLPA
jgi:seryl-tRNA synthetase